MTEIRPAQWPKDHSAIAALEIEFTTDRIYRPVRGDLSFQLVAQPIDPPRRKRYALNLEERHEWDCALVAEATDGRLIGFAAAQHVSWNRRVVIQHLYIASNARRSGVGTRLLAALDGFARSVGARHLWLETQNVNAPAIQFYRRSGFQFCGYDESLYDPQYVPNDEIALFFSRSVMSDPGSAAPPMVY